MCPDGYGTRSTMIDPPGDEIRSSLTQNFIYIYSIRQHQYKCIGYVVQSAKERKRNQGSTTTRSTRRIFWVWSRIQRYLLSFVDEEFDTMFDLASRPPVYVDGLARSKSIDVLGTECTNYAVQSEPKRGGPFRSLSGWTGEPVKDICCYGTLDIRIVLYTDSGCTETFFVFRSSGVSPLSVHLLMRS